MYNVQLNRLKVIFLGTPPFVQSIKDQLAKYFILVNSLNEADLGVVAAYGRILTKDELNTPKYGCINIHPSLLPKYRGPSPIQEAILNGDKISGITIIKMDEKVDHGPIIYQEEMELSDMDNFDTLSKKMFHRAAEILPKIIEDFISGKIKPYEQDHTKTSFCQRLTRKSGYFDLPAGRQVSPVFPEQLDRMIRAYFPWPGVWTRWKNKIVKFIPFIRHPRPDRGSINNNSELDSRLRGNNKFLIQMEGKKVMSMQDFLNGYPDFPLKELNSSSLNSKC